MLPTSTPQLHFGGHWFNLLSTPLMDGICSGPSSLSKHLERQAQVALAKHHSSIVLFGVEGDTVLPEPRKTASWVEPPLGPGSPGKPHLHRMSTDRETK